MLRSSCLSQGTHGRQKGRKAEGRILAKLSYSGKAFSDLESFTDSLLESGPSVAVETVGLIEEAVAVLKRHPLIGRPVEHDLRELVISRGRTGFVALYSFEQEQEVIMILALRHQGEAGYLLQDEA